MRDLQVTAVSVSIARKKGRRPGVMRVRCRRTVARPDVVNEFENW